MIQTPSLTGYSWPPTLTPSTWPLGTVTEPVRALYCSRAATPRSKAPKVGSDDFGSSELLAA